MMTNKSDLEKELEKLIQTCQDMTDVLKKSKETNPYAHDNLAMNSFYKNCEDGILNNIDTANEYQLKRMMSYHFRYYTEYNTDKELLKNKIKEIIRDNRINKII